MNQFSNNNNNNNNDVEQIKIFQPGASIENKNIIDSNNLFFVYCTTVSAIIIEKSTNRIKSILNKNNNKFIKCIALNKENFSELAIFYDLEIFLYDINVEKIISSIEAENVIKMEFNKEKKLLILNSKGELFYVNLITNNNNLDETKEQTNKLKLTQIKIKNFCLNFQWNPFNANNFAYANNKNEIYYINILQEKKELSYYKISSEEKEDENMKISCMKWYDLDEEYKYILIGTSSSLILLIDLSEKSTLINKFERFGNNEIENLFWLNFEPGSFISVNKNSGKYLIWNVSKVSYNKICKLNDFPIFNSVKFNENCILFSNEKGDINVFNLLNQKIEYKIENSHCQSIFDVKFNKFTKNYFASCSFDSTIKIWDLNTNKVVATLFATSTKMSNEIKKVHFICLKWSPLDKNLLASGDSEMTIRIWNIETKKEIANFICAENQKEKSIQGIDWNINNTIISSCGNFVFFLLFKDNKSLIKTGIVDCFSNVFRVIFDSSNENQIIIPCFDGKIKFYNYKKQEKTFIKEFSGHKQKVYAIEFDKKKNFLASSSDDLKIGIWSMNSNSLVNFLMGHTDNVRQLLWLENNILLSGSWDRTIRFWNINEMICVNIIKEHQSDVYGLDASSEFNNLIVSSSRDNTIRLWNYKKSLSLKNLVGFENFKGKNVYEKCFELCKCYLYEEGLCDLWKILNQKENFREEYYKQKENLMHEIKAIKESKQLNFYLKKQTKIKELIIECAKFGLWKDYCELNILIENWEDAIISAPNVSLNYWKFLTREYTKFCEKKNNENLLFSSLISNDSEISINELIKRKEFEEAKLVWASRLNKKNEEIELKNENDDSNEDLNKILFNDEIINNIFYKDCINNLFLGNPILCCNNFLILNDTNNAIKCLIQTNQIEIAYLLMKITNNFLYNNEIINAIFENKKNSSSNDDLKDLINSSNNSINKLLLSYKINPPIPIGKLLEINKNEEFFNLILENNKKEIINIFMKESEILINNLYNNNNNEKIDEENLNKIYKLLEIIKQFEINFEEIEKNEFSRIIIIVLILECFNNNYKSLTCLIIEFLLSNKFLIENIFDKKGIDFIYNYIQFEKNYNKSEYLINEDKIKFLSQFLNDSNKNFNINEIKTLIKNFKNFENKKFLCDDEINKFYFIKSELFPTNSINNNLSSFSGKIIKNNYIKLKSGNFACLSEFLEISKFLNIK